MVPKQDEKINYFFQTRMLLPPNFNLIKKNKFTHTNWWGGWQQERTHVVRFMLLMNEAKVDYCILVIQFEQCVINHTRCKVQYSIEKWACFIAPLWPAIPHFVKAASFILLGSPRLLSSLPAQVYVLRAISIIYESWSCFKKKKSLLVQCCRLEQIIGTRNLTHDWFCCCALARPSGLAVLLQVYISICSIIQPPKCFI